MARDIVKTERYAVSRRQRKKVEMLFPHLKRLLGSQPALTARPERRDEFFLAAAAQNLQKLAKLIPLPIPAPAG